jgi:hypothetical protein
MSTLAEISRTTRAEELIFAARTRKSPSLQFSHRCCACKRKKEEETNNRVAVKNSGFPRLDRRGQPANKGKCWHNAKHTNKIKKVPLSPSFPRCRMNVVLSLHFKNSTVFIRCWSSSIARSPRANSLRTQSSTPKSLKWKARII